MSPFDTVKRTILIADDELDARSCVAALLRVTGYSVVTASNGEEVVRYVRDGNPVSAVLLDIKMPRKDGLETLVEIREIAPEVPVIMVSGESSLVNVVTAMKLGAVNFIQKPVDNSDLEHMLRTTLDPEWNKAEADTLPAEKSAEFISTNPRVREITKLLTQVGRSEVTVLIQGETGSGKEVLAREIHARSRRASKVFLKLNCAALPTELVESELFGYERGAFTGAFQRKAGMFELADGGTLMLDEIGDMDFNLQSKLLQVLQDREFHRLGGREMIRVNVRVLAATHKDVEEEIENGRFRADLFYRLAVVNLVVPPLRERCEDIIPLAEFLLRKHASDGIKPPALTDPLKEALLKYRWPGNVRELENTMRKFTVLQDASAITDELLARAAKTRNVAPTPVTASSPRDAAAPILTQVTRAKEQAETEAILSILNANRWNRKQAAAILKIDYKALLYRMKKLGIDEKPLTSEE